jgi:tetratricopeptide (TPR) repeat protein
VWAANNLWDHLGWFDSTRVAHGGHVGGLVTGVLAGGFLAGRSHPGFFGSRARRAFAAAVVAIGLLVAIGMDPQWAVRWKRSRAIWSSPPDKPDASECLWEELEEIADPTRPVEAIPLADAAEYRIEHDQIRRARALYDGVAGTLGSEARARIGVLQAWSEPCDDSAAVRSFIGALVPNSYSPQTMRWFADLLIWTEDERYLRPEDALRWARFAVIADGDRSPENQQTLAWAYFACGERRKAVRALRRAIELAPGNAAEFESDLIAMTTSSPRWRTMSDRDRWNDRVEATRLAGSTEP